LLAKNVNDNAATLVSVPT